MKEKIIDSCLIFATFLAALISYLGIGKELRIGRVCYSFLAFCILIGILLLLIWLFFFIERPKSFNNNKKNKIYKYLEDLYLKTGHCYIFSRGSMSWYNYGTIKDSLLKKCKERQLTIIVPHENDFTNELKLAGGIIFTYTELNIENFASWSIINPEGTDCVVALGNDICNKHYIKKYNINNIDFMKISKLVTKLLDNLSKHKESNN